MPGTDSRPGFFKRVFGAFNTLRLIVVNLVFLFVLLLVLAVMLQGSGVAVPSKAALVVDPAGMLVEQLSYADPFSEFMRVTGNEDEQREFLLADVVESIRIGADDPRIKVLVLNLNGLYGTGLAKLNDVGAAVDAFRKSGKRVIAYGDYFDQNQYALASYADEIYLNPMGMVELLGYGVYDNYYKDALDKLLIDYHVFRAGKFKSAVEPYLRNDMSEQAKSNHLAWLNVLWQQYTALITKHRDISVDKFNAYIANQPDLLQQHGGDGALLALDTGLVDGLRTREEITAYLAELVGAVDDAGDYQHIYFDEYLHHEKKHAVPKIDVADKVGVIVAQGEIVDGMEMPGMVGGDSLAELIRIARDDEDVKAVVLRVDSPGGSVFASEVIRQELLALQHEGVPVVVSMSSLAASGGYWISAGADEIWASPSTLTGSIGVYGALPTLSRSLEKLGVHSDGVGTTTMADAYALDRPMNPHMKDVMQQGVDYSYQRFLKIVGEGRKMEIGAVDRIAQGQVWTGEQAKQLGLVDNLGNLEQAVQAAAKLAKIEKYRVETIEPVLTPFESLMLELSQQAKALQAHVDAPSSSLVKLFKPFLAELAQLQRMNDPRGWYSHCLECSGF
jgi:protease-4